MTYVQLVILSSDFQIIQADWGCEKCHIPIPLESTYICSCWMFVNVVWISSVNPVVVAVLLCWFLRHLTWSFLRGTCVLFCHCDYPNKRNTLMSQQICQGILPVDSLQIYCERLSLEIQDTAYTKTLSTIQPNISKYCFGKASPVPACHPMSMWWVKLDHVN